jgi:hypothetical protein
MKAKERQQTQVAAKYIGLVVLLAGVLFGTSPGARTQERHPPPRNIEMKAFLRVSPLFQGNCSPLNFRVTNTGGSNSGEFTVNIFRGEREQMSADTLADKLTVEDLKPKESRTFEWSNNLNGKYTVEAARPGERRSKPEGRVIEIETHCIK